MRFGLTIIVSAALLNGCATGMSQDECLSADWRSLGERDGLAGKEPEHFNERAANCAEFGVSADLAAYKGGRDYGLQTYCAPENGFEIGSRGERYRNVCPANLEAAFLEEYDLGRELHRVNEQYNDAVEDYEDALQDLDTHRYELKGARNRYRENTLTELDREGALEEIREHRRRIEDLEYKLPLLEADIDRARDELDDFRTFLARRRY